jgi:hypothetical protein
LQGYYARIKQLGAAAQGGDAQDEPPEDSKKDNPLLKPLPRWAAPTADTFSPIRHHERNRMTLAPVLRESATGSGSRSPMLSLRQSSGAGARISPIAFAPPPARSALGSASPVKRSVAGNIESPVAERTRRRRQTMAPQRTVAFSPAPAKAFEHKARPHLIGMNSCLLASSDVYIVCTQLAMHQVQRAPCVGSVAA